MGEVVLLAIASAFWPILLAVVLIALRAQHPPRLLMSFLVGGLLTTVTIGLVIVEALDGSSLITTSKGTFDPVVYLVAGALALLAALVLQRRYQPPSEADDLQEPSATTERLQRALDRGVPVAFAAGVVLNILPSPFAVVALKDIAELNYSFAETVVAVLLFYVIVFAFLEIPLVSYLFAPESTAARTVRFNAWLNTHWHRLAVWILVAFGVYLVVKGVVQLVD